jgi:sRNA-binding protein
MVEAKRKEAKDPFLMIGQQIDALAKPLIERLQAIRARTDAMLLRYRREMERKAEEQRQIQEQERMAREAEERKRERDAEIARRKNLPPPAPLPVPVAKPVEPIVEVPKVNVHTRKITVLRIGDPTLIPQWAVSPTTGEKFILLIVNEAEVKRALQAGCVIPTCSLVQEEGVSRR